MAKDITWTIETSDPTEFATVRGAERLQERWILSKSRLPASLQGIKASSAQLKQCLGRKH